MEPHKHLAPSGSIEDVVARLVLWCTRARTGLARVEFDSEFARVAAVDRLRSKLSEAGIAFHEIALPLHRPPIESVQTIINGLNAAGTGVASISGFATAFPEDMRLPDALGVLNFQRDNLAKPPLCQIWWMPRRVAEVFIQDLPDLNSWFIVRLHLTEQPPAPDEGITFFPSDETPAVNIDQARSQAASLAQRYERALMDATPEEAAAAYQSLAVPAVNALRAAKAEREAADLQRRLTLIRILNSLTPVQLDEILFSTGMPASEQPPAAAPHGERTFTLLQWAESPNGCGLEKIEQTLPIELPDTLQSLDELAGLYWRQGRYAEAEPLYGRALAVSERELGAEHPDTLRSINNLAALYTRQGRYAEAEALYGRALAGRERVLGAEHPDTLVSVNNLAGLYYIQGRYAEAEPLYARAVSGFRKVLGDSHPTTQTVAGNYVELLRKLGRDAEADALEASLST